MPAYVIALRETPVTDPEALVEYSRRNRECAAAWQAAHGITPLVVYGQSETPEGAAPDGIVILSFPTMADAKAWYASPEYQAAIKLREKAAQWRVMIVEGLPGQA
jgi:uncharacterized protein (DUF1330 family)